MIKRPIFIVCAAILAGIGVYVYFQYRIPPGVTPQGDSADSMETIAWIGLATGIVSLFTAIVGLITNIVEHKGKA